MSVDQKAYDLACSFLPPGASAEQKDELAARIQGTVDDFFVELESIAEGLEFAASERAVTEIPSPL